MDQLVKKETKEAVERVNKDCLLDQPPSDITPQDDEHLLNTLANEIAARYPDILDSSQLFNTSEASANVGPSYQESAESEFHSVSNAFDSGNLSNKQLFLNSSQTPVTQIDLMESYFTGINQVSPIYLQENQGIQEVFNLSKESISNISKGFALNNSISDCTIFEGKDESFSSAKFDATGLLYYSHDNMHSSNKPEKNIQSKSELLNNETETCSFCKKGIKEHDVVDEGKKMYECCICRHRSDRKRKLLKHLYTFGSDHFFCNTCKSIESGKGLHDKELKCYFCNEKFYCFTSYKQHSCQSTCRKCRRGISYHVFEHEGEKYCHCCRCSFISKTANDLILHLESHVDGNFMCEVCNRGFRKKHHMLKHTRIHPNELPVKCKTCSARFSSRIYLNVHSIQAPKCMNDPLNISA